VSALSGSKSLPVILRQRPKSQPAFSMTRVCASFMILISAQEKAWIHQLNENWADRAHFHTGADLVEELFKTMKKLLPIQHREP
jgi:hypothetical protein